MGSPKQCRAPIAPPPPVPSISHGQRYTYLPSSLAAQLAALPPMPQPTRRLRHSASLASVSCKIVNIFVKAF